MSSRLARFPLVAHAHHADGGKPFASLDGMARQNDNAVVALDRAGGESGADGRFEAVVAALDRTGGRHGADAPDQAEAQGDCNIDTAQQQA